MQKGLGMTGRAEKFSKKFQWLMLIYSLMMMSRLSGTGGIGENAEDLSICGATPHDGSVIIAENFIRFLG